MRKSERKPRNGSTVRPADDNPFDYRLARIEGQVGGVRKMHREGRGCVELLTQISAIQAALDQVRIAFLTHHVGECVKGEGCLPPTVLERMTEEERSAETKTALDRFVK